MKGLYAQGVAYRDSEGVLRIAKNTREANKNKAEDTDVVSVAVMNYQGYPLVNWNGKLRPIVSILDGDITVDGVSIEESKAVLANKVKRILQRIGL